MAKDTSAGGLNPLSIMRDMLTAWRLLWDPRVPAMLKLVLPVAAFLYFLSPLDLLPGPFDDIAVLVLALRFFVQAAPTAAVNEARNEGNASTPNDEDVNDTTRRVVDDK
ncbi:MAG: hypothetical protein M3Q45_01690 [Chloroflexota bacterium]|nr:hypothetical protein [Chloroflexota bacterium]